MKTKGRPKSTNIERGRRYNAMPKNNTPRAHAYESSKVVIRKKLAERAKARPKGPTKRAVMGQNLLRYMRKTPLK